MLNRNIDPDNSLPVQAVVIKVTDCWWMKINRKPMRMHGPDGAQYPHILHLQYSVNGNRYKGCRWLSWTEAAPVVGDTIPILCDASNPKCFVMK